MTTQLTFYQPSLFRAEYHLRDENSELGTLLLPSRFRHAGNVVLADGTRWEFRSIDFFRMNFEVFKEGDIHPSARYRYNFWGRFSEIQMANGDKYLMRFQLITKKVSILTELEMPLAVLRRTGVFRLNYIVEVESGHPAFRKYPWLLFLPVHIAVLRRRRASNS